MIEKLLEKMNENKFFIGVMMIIVTIGGRFIIILSSHIYITIFPTFTLYYKLNI